MNRLPLQKRVQILSALVEGNSIRGTCRMVGVDKKTVLRLFADARRYCEPARPYERRPSRITLVF